MIRAFSVVRASWTLYIKAATAFRWDLLIGTAVSIAWVAVTTVPVLVAGRLHADAGGWSWDRLLFLQAVWYWMDAVVWVFLLGNVHELQEDVRQGRLDSKLMMPTDSLLLVTLGRVNVVDSPKFLVAFCLGAVAVKSGALPGGPGAIIAFIISLVAASIFFWTIAVFASLKVLTQFRFDGSFVILAIHNLARVPTSMYGAGLRILLSTLVPVVLLSTFPSTLFFGWTSSWRAIIPTAIATLSVLLLRAFWRGEMQKYVGLQG